MYRLFSPPTRKRRLDSPRFTEKFLAWNFVFPRDKNTYNHPSPLRREHRAKYREKGEGFTNDIIASIRRSTEPCELGGGDNGARLEHSWDPRGYEHPLVAAIHSWKKEQRRQREHHAQQPRRDACPQPALQPRQRLAAQPEPIQRQRDVQGEKGLFPSGIHVSGRAEPGRNHHRAVNQLASFQRAISLPPPFRFLPCRAGPFFPRCTPRREENLFEIFFTGILSLNENTLRGESAFYYRD